MLRVAPAGPTVRGPTGYWRTRTMSDMAGTSLPYPLGVGGWGASGRGGGGASGRGGGRGGRVAWLEHAFGRELGCSHGCFSPGITARRLRRASVGGTWRFGAADGAGLRGLGGTAAWV